MAQEENAPGVPSVPRVCPLELLDFAQDIAACAVRMRGDGSPSRSGCTDTAAGL